MPAGNSERVDSPGSTNCVDERQLVSRLLEQRSEAWREFVVRYQQVICARIRRASLEYQLRLTDIDVEDICADVFSALIEKNMAALRMFRHQCRLTTWLSVIARRAALRHVRKQPSALPLSESNAAADAMNGTAPATSSLQRLVAVEEQAELKQKLAQLSLADRTVLELFYEREWSYKRIGSALGISTNAVGPKIHRAQQRLLKLMRRPFPARIRSSEESPKNNGSSETETCP